MKKVSLKYKNELTQVKSGFFIFKYPVKSTSSLVILKLLYCKNKEANP